jgi:hypothetical protein
MLKTGGDVGKSARAARTKILVAVAGGVAVVAMGGLTVVFDEGTLANAGVVAAPVMPGPMTQGETVTTSAPASVLATEKAAPTHKAQPYHG